MGGGGRGWRGHETLGLGARRGLGALAGSAHQHAGRVLRGSDRVDLERGRARPAVAARGAASLRAQGVARQLVGDGQPACGHAGRQPRQSVEGRPRRSVEVRVDAGRWRPRSAATTGCRASSAFLKPNDLLNHVLYFLSTYITLTKLSL